MKESFEKLVLDLKESRKKCPWSMEREIREHLNEVISEANEAIDAAEKHDNENLKEEIGDLLMDVLFIAVVAEEKKLFTIDEMIKEVNKKLVRRKPWVFGNESLSTKEQVTKRWNEIKAQEKLAKAKE